MFDRPIRFKKNPRIAIPVLDCNLYAGELNVIRTKYAGGKTMLTSKIALDNVRDGYNVIYVTFDETTNAIASKIMMWGLKGRTGSPQLRESIINEIRGYGGNLVLSQQRSYTQSEDNPFNGVKVLKQIKEHNIDLVVIDGGNHDSNTMYTFMLKCNVPVIFTSPNLIRTHHKNDFRLDVVRNNDSSVYLVNDTLESFCWNHADFSLTDTSI
jgi:KaiC/GvpD/RAD55 family RecA-like ATPase